MKTWTGDSRPSGFDRFGSAGLAIAMGLFLAAACSAAAGSGRSTQPAPPPAVRMATPTAAPTPTPTPPDLSGEGQVIAAILAAGGPTSVETLLSPDESLLAEVRAHDCVEIRPGEAYAYQELRLLGADSETGRAAASQLIACGGLGAYGLAPRFWSPSSQYLYYTDAASGVPDGCGFWKPSLIRLDTETMESERLDGAAISPQGDLVAAWQAKQIGVWSVDGPRLGLVEIPTTMDVPGPIAWRPDGSAIAALVTEAACPLGRSDLVRIDLADLRPIVILSYGDPVFADIVWDTPNRVTLTDEDGERWRYNFLSRDLWPVDK